MLSWSKLDGIGVGDWASGVDADLKLEMDMGEDKEHVRLRLNAIVNDGMLIS